MFDVSIRKPVEVADCAQSDECGDALFDAC